MNSTITIVHAAGLWRGLLVSDAMGVPQVFTKSRSGKQVTTFTFGGHHASSFEGALFHAIKRGADADTVEAVAEMIVGRKYRFATPARTSTIVELQHKWTTAETKLFNK